MGKLNKLDIVFRNRMAVFYGGQTVDGHVILDLSGEMKMQEICVRINGHALVRWTESRQVLFAQEEYMDLACTVNSEGSSKDKDLVLKPGCHTFPFQFQLPPHVPSSFEGDHGRVRYTVYATIVRRWHSNHSVKKVFTVVCPIDLNTYPGVMLGGKNEKEVTLSSDRKSGPVRGKLVLDRTGFVPGEIITVQAIVENQSSSTITESKVGLIMSVTCHAPTKTRTDSEEVGVVYGDGPVRAGHTDTWVAKSLVVPPLPSSDLPGCSIINIKYELVLSVSTSGAKVDLAVPVTVTIGSFLLPIAMEEHGRPTNEPTLLPFDLGGGSYDDDADDIDIGLHYSDDVDMPTVPDGMLSAGIPPPTYKSCTLGPVNVMDGDDRNNMMGRKTFNPMCLFYNWEAFSFSGLDLPVASGVRTTCQ